MGDEAIKPSTSKQREEKDGHNTKSNTDVDRQDESGSSKTSISNTRTENSQVVMSHDRPKDPSGKKQKPRNRKVRAPGKVIKRARRPEGKKPRASKRTREKKRELSVSTIFTRLSSGVSSTQGCPYCGHRCCRRRLHEKSENVRRFRRHCHVGKMHLKTMATQTSDSACIQTGSRSLMLSPLNVSVGASPTSETTEERPCSEITPEMIYEALKTLTMWRQEVHTDDILQYIKRHYPIGFGEGLLQNLTEKLQIAAIVGIVTRIGEDLWSLTSALQQGDLTRTHVTLFWETYGDTMRPVTKKKDATIPDTQQHEESTEMRIGNEIDKIFDINDLF